MADEELRRALEELKGGQAGQTPQTLSQTARTLSSEVGSLLGDEGLRELIGLIRDNLSAGGGEKGEKGDPGEAATVEVGITETGEPGTDAKVTNSGTTSAAVLDFTIPRGEKGEKGDKGEQGERGEQGEKGDTGATGATGAQGEKGDPGEAGITSVSASGTAPLTLNGSVTDGELTITGSVDTYSKAEIDDKVSQAGGENVSGWPANAFVYSLADYTNRSICISRNESGVTWTNIILAVDGECTLSNVALSAVSIDGTDGERYDSQAGESRYMALAPSNGTVNVWGCSNNTTKGYTSVKSFGGLRFLNACSLFQNSNFAAIDAEAEDATFASCTNMANMFHSCANLTNLSGLSSWNTAGVSSMANMFHSCANLTNAVIPVTIASERNCTLYQAFQNCTNLQGDIYFYGNYVSNAVNCFNGCNAYAKNIYCYAGTWTYNSFYSAMGNSTTNSLWNATLKTF